MSKKDNSKSEGFSPEQDSELWDLLGNTPNVEPGPFFSRNVLRKVRQISPEKSSLWTGLNQLFSKPALVSCIAACCLFAGLGLIINNSSQVDPASISSNVQTSGDNSDELAEEVVSLDELGELMAVSDPGVLSDEALLSLLF